MESDGLCLFEGSGYTSEQSTQTSQLEWESES